MSSAWREHVLEPFVPGPPRLTLVADPDNILAAEELAQALRTRGFTLFLYDDPIAFRYIYESDVRLRWDQGEHFEVIVILAGDEASLDQLPFDLVEHAQKVTLALNALFPQFSYPVLAELNADDLEALWKATVEANPGELGEVATIDFVLRHIFGIALEVVNEPSDLLRTLLRRHYSQQRLPPRLDKYLIAQLRSDPVFRDWPLAQVVPDREAFLAFLQERWPKYLNDLASEQNAMLVESRLSTIYGFQITGPANLPFGHDDVRVYIDNLFLEGYLRPVPVRNAKSILSTWAAVGIDFNPAEDRRRRLLRLAEVVEKSIPDIEAKHNDWLTFAHRWAELTSLVLNGGIKGQTDAIALWQRLSMQVDPAFASWLEQRYAGLLSQPPSPPVMVHHIPQTMARRLQDAPSSRLALVVIDGLAMNQWHTVRALLQEQKPELIWRESAVFAWIPTLTPISRQAIFAGKSPYYFGDSVLRTDREPELWSRFWADAGLGKNAVGYRKELGTGDLQEFEDWLSQPQLRVVGLVINIVDDIMHGTKLGMAGMVSQVGQWAESGYLAKVITFLQKAGYTVWLTADHGNIEAVGVGQPSEGATADVRGKRVRIFPTASLCSQIHQKFPDAVEWTPVGLPDQVYPLLASGRTAFAPVGQRLVTHGGASLEEVIVPFVEIGMSSA